jgi:hypothetical protein
VASATLLGDRELRSARVVGSLDLRVGDAFGCADGLARQNEIFGPDSFGRTVASAERIVVRLHLRFVDLDLADELLDRNSRLGNLAPLAEQRADSLRNRARADAGLADRLRQLADRDVVPQARRERVARHPPRPDQRVRGRLVKLSVALEARHRADDLLQGFVARRKTAVDRQRRDDALVDQRIKQRLAHVGRIEHRRIESGAESLAQPLLLLAHRLGEFLLGDRNSADHRNVGSRRASSACTTRARRTRTAARSAAQRQSGSGACAW